MSYTPVVNPLLSKEEVWKKELGFSDASGETLLTTSDDDSISESNENDVKEFHSEVEFHILQKELEKKDTQNEQLFKKIKVLEDKISLYENNLKNIEEINRSRIKVVKKTYEIQLEDKRKLIRELQHVINVLEIDTKANLNEKGKNAEVLCNFFDTVQRFSMEMNDLSSSKARLVTSVSTLETMVEMQKKELDEINKIIKNEYVAKEDYNFLLSEKSLLLKTCESYKEVSAANQFQVDNLKKGIRELEDQLSNKEKEYSVQLVSLKSENRSMKKKLREIEGKYTLMTFTPPKVRTVVDEETEKRLMKVRGDNLKLNEELLTLKSSHKRELTHLATEMEMLKANNLEQGKKIKTQDEEIEILVKEMQQQEVNFKANVVQQIKENTKTLVQEKKFKGSILLYKTLLKAVNDVSKELYTVKKEKESITCQIKHFMNFIQKSLLDVKIKLLNEVAETNKCSQILVKLYAKEIELRKQLHNQLIELRGNIIVLCRVRPVIKEDGEDFKNVVTFDPEDNTIIKVDHKSQKRLFKMDKVYNGFTSQAKIFSDVESLVTSCLDGYNVCIFAYGQTGSGKTYTMEGIKSDPGINQQALCLLFKECSEKLDWKYSISVSYMEIYNEMLRDLLSSDPTIKLSIKQNKDGVHVPGLTSIQVKNVHNVNEVFALGQRNRITAATDMNAHSSRSHSVFVISVNGTNMNTNIKFSGKLNLVDLAGSERLSKSGSEGIRKKETQSINASLSSLSNVIHSLKNKSSHIPYRNSKLTYLLQDSLGGNSKTLMVVQVSPVEKNSGETVCSLSFAERIRNVELGQASRKIEKVVNDQF